MAVHIFGVRHHGPGSARSVAAALEYVQPHAVVIEGPPELDGVVELAANPGMTPPVACLVYASAEPQCAEFYPLAAFSPEWVAMRWAQKHGVPVRFADLPATNGLALRQKASDTAEGKPQDDSEPDDAHDRQQVRDDPLSLLSATAGYDDPERWWEDCIELRSDSALDRFALVTESMQQVRQAHPELNSDENNRREAAMRKVLRAVMAEHETVAVVCGAFHAPALLPDGFPSRTADNKLLTKLPKVKVSATWVPWTNDRLSRASGYGAGVTAPGWYEHMFARGDQPADDVTIEWLVQVSHALRRHDVAASVASTVEATRLAQALASVRGRPTAGLEELDDAAVTVIGEGSAERIGLVRRELFVGSTLGTVPEDTPMVPLVADLTATMKSLRLKQSAEAKTVTLDLRQESQRARSTLFHRLLLLGVEWAQPTETGRTTGTFKEMWTLEWAPELSVSLIEASLFGTTVESACSEKVSQHADNADLATLSTLVEQCLLADLPDGLAHVIDQLGAQTAHSHDIHQLLRTIEPLARTVRYGDVRGLDICALRNLVHVVVTRVSVGLRVGCQSVDDDSAAQARDAIDAAHRGVMLLDDDALTEPWVAALMGLGEDVHGAISGRIDRLLLDAGHIDSDVAAQRMSRRLSAHDAGPQSAAWLDSFLTGDAVLLLHDATLLGLIDGWVSTLTDEAFDDVLPLIRRTFSQFSSAERSHLGNQLAHDRASLTMSPTDLATNDILGKPAMLTTARLLGLEVRT